MGRNLTNLFVSESFQYILQRSGSEVTDGLGNDVDTLNLTVTSASFATGNVVTASAVDSTITFEKGDGSTFDVTITQSGSIASASYADYAETAGSASYVAGANVDGAVANSTDALYAQNTVTTGKNLEATEIAKGTPLYFTGSGTAGNLVGIYRADAGNPARMPAGGVAGEAIAAGAEGRVLLDGYIGGVDTSAFQSGDLVYVAVGGGYTNVKPTGSANQIQYLGNVEKSAINGSGVINMMGEAHSVPNIQENYLWKGDADGVAQPVAESSLSVGTAALATTASYVAGANVDGQVASAASADTATSASHALVSDTVNDTNVAYKNQDNIFTGTQTFDNIAVNGTGSFAYIESVTGSAKVIGDAFLILNNDTPTERYAGIKVVDSGSTFATASFLFDGSTNDWFYEYTSSGDSLNHGVVMFGPEYGTIGSPVYPSNNTILKGDGGHHVLDSNITDDGTTIKLNSDTQITGSLNGSGSFNIKHPGAPTNTERHLIDLPSYTTTDGVNYPTRFIGLQNYPAFGQGFEGGVTITHADPGQAYNYYSELNVSPNIVSMLCKPSGSATVSGLAAGPNADLSETYTYIYADDIRLGNNIPAAEILIGANATEIQISGSVSVQNTITGEITNAVSASHALQADNSSTASYIAGANVDGEVTSAATASYVNPLVQDVQVTGSFDGDGNFNYQLSTPANNTESHIFDLGSITTSDGASYPIRWVGQQNYGAFGQAFEGAWSVSHLDPGAAYSYYTEMLVGPNAAQMQLKPNGSGTLANVSLGAASDLSSTFASIFANQVNVGTLLTQEVTIGNGSATVAINGEITGSIKHEVVGLTITSNTASFDGDHASYFTLGLVSGSNTHIEATNFQGGKTYILKTLQPSAGPGTITFDSAFKFAGGVPAEATAASNAEDIYTFVTYDTSNIYSTQVADLK